MRRELEGATHSWSRTAGSGKAAVDPKFRSIPAIRAIPCVGYRTDEPWLESRILGQAEHCLIDAASVVIV